MARKSRKNVVIEPVNAALYIRTALYVRLSVEDGKGHSNSIENQQLILNDYVADKPDFLIVDTYIDNGLSGMTFDRPDFQRMLADIESGKVTCVIVKDLSRLGRNAIDTGYYIEQYFVQHKIRFISVNDNFDTAKENSLSNGIILPLKNMINEAYALDIGKKIKSAAHQAMLDGEFIGARAPFGYKKDPNNCHKLLIDEETAPIVRQIFEWAADGIGLNTIAVRLNEMGTITSSVHKSQTSEVEKQYKKARSWTTFSIGHILENDVYTGDMVQGKRQSIEHKVHNVSPEDYIVVRNTHEAIVSRELFEKVHHIRESVRSEYKDKEICHYTENIFKGKIFCPHCGKPLHRQRGTKKTSPAQTYYINCLSRSRISKDACIGVFLREDYLIDKLTQAVKTELATLGKSFSVKRSDNKIEALKKRKSEKQRELGKVQSLIKGLYESLVQGVISNDEYTEFKNAYNTKSLELNSEIEQLSAEIENLVKQQKQFAEVKENSQLFGDSKKLTAELIERLIERIEISHDREITVFFRSGRKECV